MRRIGPARLLCLIALTVAIVIASLGPATASTPEEFLNVPVWYLEYEVSLKSAYQGTYDYGEVAKMAVTLNLERVFSGAAELNLRSEGPGAFTMTALAGASGGAAPSTADALKINEKMMAMMGHTANWLVAGNALDENATDPTAGMMGLMRPARLDYKRVDTAKGLEDESGNKFDLTMTTTVKGQGNVTAGGFGSISLEMDTAEKSYLLVLPLGFAGGEEKATRETVEVTQAKGSPPTEERKTEEVALDVIPQGLALAEPPAGTAQGGLLIRGALDPSTGKITGEQSFKVHFEEPGNLTVPGTIVAKYTLTMTPPKPPKK